MQDVGQGGKEFQIRVLGAPEGGSSGVADAIKAGLREKFGEGTYDVLRVETVGPKVGKDLWRDATLAVLAATLVMATYIALRFEIRFGIGAAVALMHDVLITLGALSIANMEFDLTTVAALLTVVGYSVHDTVIVSDRIRENMRKMRRETLATRPRGEANAMLTPARTRASAPCRCAARGGHRGAARRLLRVCTGRSRRSPVRRRW